MTRSAERDPISSADEHAGDGPKLVVVAPSLLLEVAVEVSAERQDEIHTHPGGQGFWVARMAARLGARVKLCTTLAGESGDVIAALIERTGIELDVTRAAHSTPALILDRRQGEARELARSAVDPLGRHDVDELFVMSVAAGLEARTVLITGPREPSQIDPDFYRRLVGDLRGNDVFVGADLSKEALKAALESGLDLLKATDHELVETGLADGDEHAELLNAMDHLAQQGVSRMLISRGDKPALAFDGKRALEVRYPQLESHEPRGTGDSIFATLAVRLADGDDWERAIRWAVAAGTLNVTRRGLGSAHRRDVEAVAERIEVSEADQA